MRKSTNINHKVGVSQLQLFGNQPVLKGSRITGILVMPPGADSADGTPGYVGDLGSVYLQLTNAANAAVHEGISLKELQRAPNGGHTFDLGDLSEVDWNKSGLFFANGAELAAGNGKGITLTAFYAPR